MEILHIIWTVYSILCVIFTTVFLWNLVRNIRREIDLVKDSDTVKKTMKLVYIEQVDDMFRMHDKFTDQYICQASTEKELWDLADAKFPYVKIMYTSIGKEVNKL
jgi:Na+-transporting NADH:ubiquinone oxidoreductase subunit NqrB